MVPAASRSASSPPTTFKCGGVPERGGVLAEGVRGQVADLQPGELTQELLERHPDRTTDASSYSWLLNKF